MFYTVCLLYTSSHLNIDGVGGSYNIINEKGEFIQKVIMTAQSPEMIKATLLFRNCIANGSVTPVSYTHLDVYKREEYS